jgi:hypothetical protein
LHQERGRLRARDSQGPLPTVAHRRPGWGRPLHVIGSGHCLNVRCADELYRQVPWAGIREHPGTIQVLAATEVGDCSLGRYEHNKTEYYGGRKEGRKEPHQPSANEAITSVSGVRFTDGTAESESPDHQRLWLCTNAAEPPHNVPSAQLQPRLCYLYPSDVPVMAMVRRYIQEPASCT